MRLPSNQSLEERQQTVIGLFEFIRDFNKLDTTLLIEKIYTDPKFLEAAEAVLTSAVGPWKSVDALCDFAVQSLFGQSRPTESLADRARGRVSPFSVPFALLRALAPNPGTFDPHQLRSLTIADAIDVEGFVGKEDRWTFQSNRDETWLVTTMWARTIPAYSTHTRVRVEDQGANRLLHEGAFAALCLEAQPCFWWLPPNSLLHVTLTRQQQDPRSCVILAIEGWRFTR